MIVVASTVLLLVLNVDIFPSIVNVEVPALPPEDLLAVSVIVPAVFPIDPFVAVSEIFGAVVLTDLSSFILIPSSAEIASVPSESTLIAVFLTFTDELPDLASTPSPVPLNVTFGDSRVAPVVSISNSDPASVLAVIPSVETISVVLLLMLTVVALTPNFVPAMLV